MMGDADPEPPGNILDAPLPGSVTDDVFLAGAPGGGLRMLQPKDGLRSGIDAVLLAAAVPARIGERVLDAGAGVGVAGLCVARRCPLAHVTLVERETALATLARHNIARNGFGAAADIVCADLTWPAARLRTLGLVAEGYDHVLTNPPFHDASNVRASPHPLKAAASALATGELDRWLRFAAAMAKPGGRVTLIHRAEALREILDAIGARFGALRILPLHARPERPAVRVIVQGIKGSRAPLTLLPGFVLHERAEAFTRAANARLRDGAPLDLGDPGLGR